MPAAVQLLCCKQLRCCSRMTDVHALGRTYLVGMYLHTLQTCMTTDNTCTPTRWNRTTGPLSPYGFEVRTPRQRRSGRQKHVGCMLQLCWQHSTLLLSAASRRQHMPSRDLPHTYQA